MKDLEVGMFIRFKDGTIDKLIEVQKKVNYYILKYSNKSVLSSNGQDSDIIKASHNIIDLIEVGDYVNGILVASMNMAIKPTPIPQYWNEQKNEFEDIDEGEIKTILTKEQYENNCYKIGE